MILDPMTFVVLGAVLVFFFFVYLLLRRTLLGFREGVDEGKR